MKFTWDPNKQRKVLVEHRVDFDKIKDIFKDPYALEFIDDQHSDETETRYGLIGLTAEYGLIYFLFVAVDLQTTRFITARRAERWMVKDYEKEARRI